jgi:hypothetical protein
MTRSERWWLTLLATALLLASACASDDGTYAGSGIAREVDVGGYTVALAVPGGWEHLDYGREHLFRRDLQRISLEQVDTGETLPEFVPDRVLTALHFESSRRSIRSRRAVEVNGREFVIVDTWDKLSHQYPRRYAMTIEPGAALVMYTAMGTFAEMEGAFDSILAAIRVLSVPEPPQESATD